MVDFFFGSFAVTGWFAAASIFFFCASYVAYILITFGSGLRGVANLILFTSLAIVCSCFGLILSKQTLISDFMLGAIVTSVFPPILIAVLVLTDIYAGDRSDGHSFTARSYLAYKRFLERNRDSGSHSPVRLGHRA